MHCRRYHHQPRLHIVPNAGHISLVVERAEDVLRELLAAN